MVALVDVDVELDVVLDVVDDSREDIVVDVDGACDKDVDGDWFEPSPDPGNNAREEVGDWFEPSPDPGNNAREEVGSRAKLVLLVVDDLYEVEDRCA